MISKALSQTLYSQLINGKTVNKHTYNSKANTLTDNPEYNELFTNFDDYQELYARINFELVHKGDSFFFIRELADREVNESTMKIQALLIIIGRIITEKGYLFDTLTDYNAGIPLEDMTAAMADERYTDILHACKLCLKRSIDEEIMLYLIQKNIAFINSKGYYVLSDAGRTFFAELTKEQ